MTGGNAKVKRLNLKQFTAFVNTSLDFSPGINVLIGANSTGKTHLLKLFYAVLQSLKNVKERQREDNSRSVYKMFAINIKGVFNIDEIDDFVRDGAKEKRSQISIEVGDARINYCIGARKGMDLHGGDFEGDLSNLNSLNAVYLPPKEFLSINKGFIAAYKNRELPYDLTYYDLAVALNASPLREDWMSTWYPTDTKKSDSCFI